MSEEYMKPTIEVDGEGVTPQFITGFVFVVFVIWGAIAIDWALAYNTAAYAMSVAMTAAAVLHVGVGDGCGIY